MQRIMIIPAFLTFLIVSVSLPFCALAAENRVWSGAGGEDVAVDRHGTAGCDWSPYREEGYDVRWDGGKAEIPQGVYPEAIIEHKYVGFGDSLTWGWTCDYWGSRGGYGPLLQELLRTIDPEAVVVLCGYGGETTSGGIGRIDSVLEEEAPEYVLILEGTNDIKGNAARWQIFDNLMTIVNKVKEYGSIPVIGTLPPRNDCWYMSDWSEELNRDYIRPFAREEKVLLADHWKFFYETPDWSSYIGADDCHPTTAGYELMAECWFIALVEDSPPEGLTVSVHNRDVCLRWDRNNNEYGFAGYNVYRKSTPVDDYEMLNDELITETSCTDTGLSSEYYVYTVAAVDRCGNESEYSNEVVVDFRGESSGCFIATAAYGTSLSDEVKLLCRFRDDVLLKRNCGRTFVNLYYKLSPPAARFISGKKFVKAAIRLQLKPVVWLAGIILD